MKIKQILTFCLPVNSVPVIFCLRFANPKTATGSCPWLIWIRESLDLKIWVFVNATLKFPLTTFFFSSSVLNLYTQVFVTDRACSVLFYIPCVYVLCIRHWRQGKQWTIVDFYQGCFVSRDSLYFCPIVFRQLFLDKVIHPKCYKQLKKGPHWSHFGWQKISWFLVD